MWYLVQLYDSEKDKLLAYAERVSCSNNLLHQWSDVKDVMGVNACKTMREAKEQAQKLNEEFYRQGRYWFD